MVAVVKSVALKGFNGVLVDVEADMRQGLPGVQIVGMGNKAIDEARERVKSGIRNSSLDFPTQKLTINLAPAEIPKNGTHFDLPIAVSVLIASGQLHQKEVKNCLFIGELALDGRLRPVRGAVFAAEVASSNNLSYVFTPLGNLRQIQLVKGVSAIGVSNLKELFWHLKGIKPITRTPPTEAQTKSTPGAVAFSDIYGHARAKRALTIAASGHHNVLLSGSPGSGKTMLAKALHGLLPPLDSSPALEVTKLHSLRNGDSGTVVSTPPLRSPHHSATLASMIGGGARLQPGEISLAHRGVLLLDELPEYSRKTLESIRQPLEEKVVSIHRNGQHVKYPADIILVATMNPCPCGYFGDPEKTCTCTGHQISSYNKKLSGPLLDRIDLRLTVQKAPFEHIVSSNTLTYAQQDKVLSQVVAARSMQHKRFNSRHFYNGTIETRKIKKLFSISRPAESFAIQAAKKIHLSTRSYYRVLRISRTIADLESSKNVERLHVTEALQFRDV